MSNELTGAKVLARMLQDYGVTDIFHVPAVLRTTMAELETISNVRRIHAHGEASAAYMADGYARASGKPGVCAAQIIGALNLAAGLRDAWLAKSPVIALTGGRDQATKFKKDFERLSHGPRGRFPTSVDYQPNLFVLAGLGSVSYTHLRAHET